MIHTMLKRKLTDIKNYVVSTTNLKHDGLWPLRCSCGTSKKARVKESKMKSSTYVAFENFRLI